jgi:hypothetical protein
MNPTEQAEPNETAKLEARKAYALAVYEEQRARCIALSPQGHWVLAGMFRVRPMTARDLAILDELVPPIVRGGKLTDGDYALLLWHMRYRQSGYGRFLDRLPGVSWLRRFWHGWRVSLALEGTTLAADVAQWVNYQTQDLGGGGGASGREYAASSVVLAVLAAGSGSAADMLDVPLITLGQIIKIREGMEGKPMFNASDELLTPEVLK